MSLVRREVRHFLSHAAYGWGLASVLLRGKWTTSNQLSMGPVATPPLGQAELRPTGHRIPQTLDSLNASSLVALFSVPSPSNANQRAVS